MKIKNIPYPAKQVIFNPISAKVNAENLFKVSYPDRQYWSVWLLALVLISIVFSLVIDVAPYLHKDEFIIVELGRVILNPGTDWSLNWLVYQNQPVFLFAYLGPVLQELAFQMIGQFGPRTIGILGALVAATAMVGWLLARGTERRAAFLLGLVFLLDPLFVQSFTSGRLDGWTMALCLTSCWILRHTTHSISLRHSLKSLLLLAGAFASLAFFIWPSAVFLFPLIAWEFFSFLKAGRAKGKNLKETASLTLVFATGGVLATLLLILPIAPQLSTQLSNILEGLDANTQARPEIGESLYASLRGVLSAVKFTPVLLILTIIAILKYRRLGQIFALIFTFSIILGTIAYIHRVLYLIPYFIVLISDFYQGPDPQNEKSFRLLKVGGLAALLIWATGLSLVIRTFMAIDAQAQRDREIVNQAALTMLGRGDYRVLLLGSAELYYPGRSLGWKMFDLYLGINELLKPKVLQQVLPQVNYVIMRDPVDQELNEILKAGGFYNHSTISLYNGSVEKFTGITTYIWRMRFLFSIYEQPYGPYKLYLRKKNNKAD